MRVFSICCLTLFITGCTASASGHYTPSASFRGSNVKDLIKALGSPYSTMTTAGGNTIYIYKKQTTFNTITTYSPSVGVNNTVSGTPVITAMPNINTPETRSLTTSCLMTFTINRQGNIIDSYADSPNCAANTKGLIKTKE